MRERLPAGFFLTPWRYKMAWADQLIAWAMALRHRAATGSRPNVGPNEPCPCGSRKKWKFCHGVGTL